MGRSTQFWHASEPRPWKSEETSTAATAERPQEPLQKTKTATLAQAGVWNWEDDPAIGSHFGRDNTTKPINLPDEWVGHSSAIGNLIQCVSGGYWKRNGASFQVAFDSLLLHLGTSHTASHCKGPEKAAATSGWIKSGTSQCRSQGKETWLQRRNRHKNHLVLLAYDLAIGWGVVLQLLLGLSGGDWIVGNNGSRCGPVRNLLQPTNASLHEVLEIRDAQTWPSKISLSWETKCHKLFVAPARNSGPWHGHRDPQHVPRQLQAGDVFVELRPISSYIPSPFSARFRPMFSAQMNHPMANPRSATARSQSKRHEWDLHDRAINTAELRPMFQGSWSWEGGD